MMKKLNRRQFIKNSSLVTLAGLGGVQVGFGSSLLKGAGAGSSKDLLVYVFLNGGIDGLNIVPPKSGTDYSEYSTVLRPSLHIPSSDSLSLNGSSAFGLHPLATGMRDLFNQDKMAIIHATGLLEPNRSHFVATALMELGIQNTAATLPTGWITRYFNSSLGTTDGSLIPSLVPSTNNTDAVLGDPTSLIMASPTSFSLNRGHWAWGGPMQETFAEIFNNPTSQEDVVAHQTLNASQIVEGIDWDNYTPGNSAQYPTGFFGNQLRTVAQMFKEDVGLEIAYIPTGGWDTHIDQGTGIGGDGLFGDLVQNLSDGLHALYQDLTASHAGKFTIIVQSEFGRRAYENDSNGTDHGYGNPMFVIGDDVNGGFYGNFPGLQPAQLLGGDDVDVTVDYRDVVSEVLMKRMHNRFLGYIFPQYANYTPLGIVSGVDLNPVYEFDYDLLYKSGFE